MDSTRTESREPRRRDPRWIDAETADVALRGTRDDARRDNRAMLVAYYPGVETLGGWTDEDEPGFRAALRARLGSRLDEDTLVIARV